MKSYQRVWMGVVFVCVMPIAAFGVGFWFANTPTSVLFALAEPFLFAALMVCASSALIAGRTALSLGLVISGVSTIIGIQQPYVDNTSPSDGPEQLRTLKGCSILSKPIESPIRIFVWTEGHTDIIAAALPEILDLQPDIVILNGSDNPRIGSMLSDALNGEAKFFAETPSTSSLTAIVRGSFQYCGAEEDVWNVPIETEPVQPSNGIIAFPHIEQIGVFPLLIPRISKHRGSWMNWAVDIIRANEIIADTSSVLGTRKLVIAGDTQVPTHPNILSQTFQNMGMQSAKSEPNWPTTMGGLPSLTLHTLDHAWVGHGWHVQSAKTINIVSRNRKPVLFDLTPVDETGA